MTRMKRIITLINVLLVVACKEQQVQVISGAENQIGLGGGGYNGYYKSDYSEFNEGSGGETSSHQTPSFNGRGDVERLELDSEKGICGYPVNFICEEAELTCVAE